jgi:hypothetical protein
MGDEPLGRPACRRVRAEQIRSLYALVQRLADLGADAEGRRRRRVPRLSDLSCPINSASWPTTCWPPMRQRSC